MNIRYLSSALLLGAALAVSVHALAQEARLDDDEVRDRMIRESLAAYSGSCPCPYNVARNGSRCGGRSAYSRPGGRSPLCYRSDITDEMVDRYRTRHGLDRSVALREEDHVPAGEECTVGSLPQRYDSGTAPIFTTLELLLGDSRVALE